MSLWIGLNLGRILYLVDGRRTHLHRHVHRLMFHLMFDISSTKSIRKQRQNRTSNPWLRIIHFMLHLPIRVECRRLGEGRVRWRSLSMWWCGRCLFSEPSSKGPNSNNSKSLSPDSTIVFVSHRRALISLKGKASAPLPLCPWPQCSNQNAT